MRTARVASIALALLTAAAATSAYVLNGPKWGVRQIPYYINPANADMSASAAIASIQNGASAWSAQSNADVSFYYMGTTTGSSLQRNGKNEMFFRSTSAGSMAAETYWWYDSSYRLVEADIVFYDGGFTFFPGATGCASGVYLEDIATHEFGHAIGLGHSSVSTASMYPSIKWCSTSVRSLDPDDLSGVEKLYPPTNSNSSPSVSITTPSSSSTFSEGTAVTFGGSATDAEDGNLSSELLWTSSRDGQIGTGPSFSRTLSVGTHTITASVSDSGNLTSSRQVSVVVQAIVTNQAPVVSIASPVNNSTVAEGTSVTFSGSGSDAEDGNLTSKLVWSSNLAGPLGVGGTFSKILTAGTHTITATVTDSDGATSRRQVTVTVAVVAAPSPAPSNFWLTTRAFKTKGLQQAELRWGGDSSTRVDIYRDGVRVATTANDGSHVDAINRRGSGSYTYKVCAAGTTTCSTASVAAF